MRLPVAVLDWFTLRRSIAIVAVVAGGLAWAVHRAMHGHGNASSVLFLAPFAALIVAPAIIGLFAGYVRWVDERTWLPVHGTYHAFDDHRIRVVEVRDRLWFSSADVHAALGIARREAVMRSLSSTERRQDEQVGEMLSNDGLVAVLGRSTDRSALRLIRWADGDVRRPWQKRRDGEGPADLAPVDARGPSPH